VRLIEPGPGPVATRVIWTVFDANVAESISPGSALKLQTFGGELVWPLLHVPPPPHDENTQLVFAGVAVSVMSSVSGTLHCAEQSLGPEGGTVVSSVMLIVPLPPGLSPVVIESSEAAWATTTGSVAPGSGERMLELARP
jgi:hypothetical protein